MRITPLGSGSQGNSLLVRTRDQQILIDAGFPLDELEARLATAGTEAKAITAICMTHRHKDHKRGVADFCREHGAAIFGAVAAGKAMGGFATVEDAQAALCRVREEVFSPIPENQAVYAQLYTLYRELHDAFGTAEWSGQLTTVMKDLIALREKQRKG